MSLSRKDYVKLATVVRKGYFYADAGAGNFDKRYKSEAVKVVEDELVRVLAEDNPRFDAARFRAACNIDQ